MSTFRGFIAVEINATSQMLEFEREIERSGADIKLVELHNIHITLKFLGDTDEGSIEDIEGIIRDAAKGIKPFTIWLKGTGVFPNENYMKVVWIGIQDGDMIRPLVHAIDEGVAGLGFKKEKREFSPHLTIGRVRTAKNKQQLLKVIEKYRDVEFSNQEVISIHLKKSDLTQKGPIYSTVREIKF